MSLTSMALLLLPRLAVLILFAHCLLLCSSAAGDVDFVYNGFLQRGANLSLDGSASVLAGGALRLTEDRSHLTGHAFLDSPVRVVLGRAVDAVAVSFSTAFVFRVVSTGSGGGSGMAFVVAASKALLPRAASTESSSYLGLLGNGTTTGNASSNHVFFAVEFDTAQQETEDGNRVVGVHLNSLASNVSAPAAYFTDDDGGGRSVSVPLESAGAVQAWVDYDGRARVLNVTIAPVSVATRPRRPLISHGIDLLPVFEKDMYVGFAAATGNSARSHYVLSWSFRKGGGLARSIDLSLLPDVPKPRAPPFSRSTVIKIVALSCAGALVAILAAVAAALWLRHRAAAVAETLEEWELDHPHRFTYKELYKATKGFRDSELLGAGGFGKVYRGVLPPRSGGDAVAIKRVSSGGTQGGREFVAEVASLGRLRHRNLVELRGWCKRGQDMLLVYELMPNGSLDARLFGNSPRPLLTWEQRVGVLRGVAAGLAYLHEGWEQVVVHRDVKASNVLLGADMAARLGDFGLARLYDRDGGGAAGHHHPAAAATTTRVVGTLGYMSPEIVHTGRATTAADVFAFGVLLLEVACGRRPVDPATGVHLLTWVRELGVKGDLVHAVDERLGGCYEEEEARLVLLLGLMCGQMSPPARPTMRQVCQYLDGELVMQEAMVVFADTDSVDLDSPGSLTSSSCAAISVGSLQSGR